MIEICGWFDRYRDGELSSAQREQFESHMISCGECRTKTSLLNNLVFVLKWQEQPLPEWLPESTARRAFQKSRSWDDFVVSWFRPAPALYAFALLLIVFSVLWSIPSFWKTSSLYYEYETLMMESEPADLGGNAPQVYTDEELTRWLGVGEDTQ
jgi:Putative zinc-finger